MNLWNPFRAFALALLLLALALPAAAGNWLTLSAGNAGKSCKPGAAVVYNWSATEQAANDQPVPLQLQGLGQLTYFPDGSAVTVQVFNCRGSDAASCSQLVKIDTNGDGIVDASDAAALTGNPGDTGPKYDQLIDMPPAHYLVVFTGSPGAATARVRVDCATP